MNSWGKAKDGGSEKTAWGSAGGRSVQPEAEASGWKKASQVWMEVKLKDWGKRRVQPVGGNPWMLNINERGTPQNKMTMST